MHVERIALKNFKRFTDFTIDELPADARLVVLTGPNGSGKSAIAEAFNVTRRTMGGWGHNDDPRYFSKANASGEHTPIKTVEVTFHEGAPSTPRAAIYIRSAYRHQADFEATSISRSTPISDDPGLDKLLNIEQRVLANYQRLVGQSVADLYDEKNDQTTGKAIRERLIGKLAELMNEVFGDLKIESPGNPFDDGTFYFSKGESKRFRYPNLSAGEKAAFDLLLDFVLATEVLKDAVYWIDEPELHLGSRVQAAMLQAFFKHLPDTCQLWVATHSLGMMRTALNLSKNNSNVSFLDMSGLNLDRPVVLKPVAPSRSFWRSILEVALDDMASLVAPEKVVLCEGEGAADGFDAVCYRKIFEGTHPDTEFISVGDSKSVKKGGHGIADAIGVVAEGTQIIRLTDKDDHTPAEISQLRTEGTIVLGRRSIESYLLGDEILAALCLSVGQSELTDELMGVRDKAVLDAGAPADDYKKARQAVHLFARNRLKIEGVGSTASRFLQEIVAPLCTPDTKTFADLEQLIFG